jgi:hypothetical protein
LDRPRAGEPNTAPGQRPADGAESRAEDVHAVLAARARESSPSELWTTAIGGTMNVMILWWQFPSLHWLASGFAAVAAYGAWGLADRQLSAMGPDDRSASAMGVLRVARWFAAALGWLAAVGAVVGFMAAALGGWIL